MAYKVTENMTLASRCSMKVGGNSKYFVEPNDKYELLQAIKDFKSKGEKYIIIGNCSNMIFSDDGFDGAVIATTSIKGVSVNDNEIKIACGESMATLAITAWKNSLSGLEFCHGIPGTVGGGVYMNAGAYNGEICQCFVSGTFLDKDLNFIELKNEDMKFDYRKSVMMEKELVLVEAVFKGEKGNPEDIHNKMKELMAKRKDKQPLEFPSCGSTFKRPEGHFAAALIDQCGLKGFSIGGAQVSEKHAGFVINSGNATASDVIELMEKITEIVLEKTGIKLEPEIRII